MPVTALTDRIDPGDRARKVTTTRRDVESLGKIATTAGRSDSSERAWTGWTMGTPERPNRTIAQTIGTIGTQEAVREITLGAAPEIGTIGNEGVQRTGTEEEIIEEIGVGPAVGTMIARAVASEAPDAVMTRWEDAKMTNLPGGSTRTSKGAARKMADRGAVPKTEVAPRIVAVLRREDRKAHPDTRRPYRFCPLHR